MSYKRNFGSFRLGPPTDLFMNFSDEELQQYVRHWIQYSKFLENDETMEIEDGVYALLMLETGGHIGVLHQIFKYLQQETVSKNTI